MTWLSRCCAFSTSLRVTLSHHENPAAFGLWTVSGLTKMKRLERLEELSQGEMSFKRPGARLLETPI
jgi:hypothetical protein